MAFKGTLEGFLLGRGIGSRFWKESFWDSLGFGFQAQAGVPAHGIRQGLWTVGGFGRNPLGILEELGPEPRPAFLQMGSGKGGGLLGFGRDPLEIP